jgi:hypothetical protein
MSRNPPANMKPPERRTPSRCSGRARVERCQSAEADDYLVTFGTQCPGPSQRVVEARQAQPGRHRDPRDQRPRPLFETQNRSPTSQPISLNHAGFDGGWPGQQLRIAVNNGVTTEESSSHRITVRPGRARLSHDDIHPVTGPFAAQWRAPIGVGRRAGRRRNVDERLAGSAVPSDYRGMPCPASSPRSPGRAAADERLRAVRIHAGVTPCRTSAQAVTGRRPPTKREHAADGAWR